MPLITRGRAAVIFGCALALVLASCTSSTDGSATATGEGTTATSEGATATSSSPDASPGGGSDDGVTLVSAPTPESDESGVQIQDVWMFTDIRGIADDGTTASVIVDMIADVRPHLGDPVPLTESLQFTPAPGLNSVFASPDGEVRTDVPVQVGLFSARNDIRSVDGVVAAKAGDATLGVITAAPSDVTNVVAHDELVLDTSQFSALADYDTVAVDYLFAQAKPSAEATYRDASPAGILAARFAADSVTWTGVDDGTGELAVAMRQGAVGGSSTPAAQAVQAQYGNGIRVSGRALHPSTPLAADIGSGFGGLLGIPIKEGIFGAPELAFTVFCFGVAVALSGVPPAAVTAAVICVAVDVVSTVSSVMDAVEDNNGGSSGGGGGSSSGEPHLRSFDGDRQDLQLVGEFHMVIADGMEVQARTTPVSQSVSVNTAVAFDIAGDVVEITSGTDDPAPGTVLVNGSLHHMRPGDRLTLPHDGNVLRLGNVLVAEWPNGSQAWVSIYTRNIDFQVVLGEVDEVTGLFGDADGNPDNDFFPLGGERPAELTRDVFYDVVAESWRVSEEDNLFSSPLTHDRSFPESYDPLDEVDDATLAWARAVCAAAGLVEPVLDDCILDVALTKDVGYVARSWNAESTATGAEFHYASAERYGDNSGIPQGVAFHEDSGSHIAVGEGLALIRASVPDVDSAVLLAIDTDTRSLRWSAEGISTDCKPAPVPGVGILVGAPNGSPLTGGDDASFALLDPSDGSVLNTFAPEKPAGLGGCAGTLVFGDIVVMHQMYTTNIFGYRITADGMEQLWQATSAPERSGPWRIGDFVIALLPRDDADAVTETWALIDPETGETVSTAHVDAVRANPAVSSLPGGYVTASRDGVLDLFRVAGDKLSAVWRITNDDFADHETISRVPGTTARLGDAVVGWIGDKGLTAFRLSDGSEAWSFRTSSFNNNGGAIAASDSVVYVGSFGGAWLDYVRADGEGEALYNPPVSSWGEFKSFTRVDENTVIALGQASGGWYFAFLDF